MTREEAMRALMGEYERKRAKEDAALRARMETARRAAPEIASLLARRAALPIESLRMAMGDKAHAREIARKMQEEGLRVNASLRKRLREAGLPEDYLQTHYECPACRDTGYTQDVPAKPCECLLRALRALNREGDGVSAFDTQNFEAFDEARIPEISVAEGVTQRQLTARVRELCQEYADTYPNTIKPNLMLMGEAGLGKTFLMNCIAARVEARGHAAVLLSAYRLLEIMRERHFHMEESEGEFERLMKCDLLLIDDLGCEPMLRNITQEYLFVLMNERLVKRRHTVIATNMTPPQLKDRYGERIMSRLCDRSVCDPVRLMGKDLRRL